MKLVTERKIEERYTVYADSLVVPEIQVQKEDGFRKGQTVRVTIEESDST
jgi:hypothetical protein